MTTTQSFKIYEILQLHLKNDENAKIVMQEIEQIIEAKVNFKKEILATKEDILMLREDLLRFLIIVTIMIGKVKARVKSRKVNTTITHYNRTSLLRGFYLYPNILSML